jgi:hypothetical protein
MIFWPTTIVLSFLAGLWVQKRRQEVFFDRFIAYHLTRLERIARSGVPLAGESDD